MDSGKKVANNIFMLYILNITQLVLPLITLPYLTRVLSVDGYGVVSYVKSIMVYVTLTIEFGFLLSGTRDVVQTKNNKSKLSLVVGRVIEAKLILSIIAFIILVCMIVTIPILHRHSLFVLLSFGTPFLSIFLCDFLFRGIEQMQVVTIRYLIVKGISTILTFVFIKSEKQLNLIPILDIIGSIFAIFWIYNEIRKLGITIKFDKLINVFYALKISFIYFVSDIASTAFGALNTFFVGIFLPASDVAYWGLTMTLVGAIQSMYNPISDGIYPHMVATKSLQLLKKILIIFAPLLIIGGGITFFGARFIILLIGGVKYMDTVVYLQESTPLLIISFFSILFGWPVLGAIDKVRETTFTTVATSILQVIGLIVLIFTKNITIPLLILVRTLTELFMAIYRILLTYRFKKCFHK